MLYDADWWNAAEAQLRAWFPNFFPNLYSECPQLSVHDLRLCTLLLSRHSSRDIANALGISIESFHTACYRLRRRLAVPHSVSTFAHLKAIAYRNVARGGGGGDS